LRDEAFCKRLVDETVQDLGGIDILVMNAGARPARYPPRETWRRLQSAKLSGQRRPFVIGDRGSEADMVQQALRVVETEQQRADFKLAAKIAKAPDNAIGVPADKLIKNWTCYYRETSLKPIIAELVELAEGR
jgi:NAD(P)-dependent dehydrogenase (short-subunit alcohol dehydrogenase family)